MNLNEWAVKWGVSFNAVEDLRRSMGVVDQSIPQIDGGISEAAVTSRIRIEASKKNIWIMRNNVGAAKLSNGRVLRYGLANESSQQNSRMKSSDLIGIKPVLITEEMVGCVIGQFIAREVKAENWQYSATEREVAQLNFMNPIIARGGDACFANSEGTL